MGFGAQQQPTKLNQAQVNQSVYGYPLPWVMGTARVQQCLLWSDGWGAQTVNIQGGKGGGKSGTEYLYYLDVIAALCNGPILGIGDVWSGQSWLGLPNATESYTVASPGIYTPTNSPAIGTNSNNYLNNVGVGLSLPYSGTFQDLGAPAATVLSGSDLVSMVQVPYGTTLATGQYSVNPNSIGTFTLTSVANASGGNTVYTGTITGGASNAFAGYTFTIAGFTNAANNGSFICAASTATTLTLQNTSGVAETHAATATEPGNTYHFDATHDAGKTLTLNYSFYLPNITEDETDIVPASKTLHVGGSLQFLTDLGVVYSAGPNNGVRLTKVSGTPTATGTYQVIGSGHGATYNFSSGDINAQVRITWITQDLSIVPQGQSRSLNFQTFLGTQGQGTWSVLTSKYPGAALGYSSKAYAAYHPMALGTSGQIQNNTFEVVTADIYGGGIKDCNPVQCVGQVLTNQQCGLGVGTTPFPVSVIDNSPGGTWGGNYPATRVQTSGGSTGYKLYYSGSVSANGQRYITSVVLRNNSTTKSVFVTDAWNNSSQTIAPGATAAAVVNGIGDGTTPLQLVFRALSVGDSLDFTIWNPSITTGQGQPNLIANTKPGSTGWSAGTGNSITYATDRSGDSTAWNWFAANGFFISPVLDSQDTAGSTIGKWLEAGMCAALYSEGLLKLVPYGDTTTAGYGCTWIAPSAYVVALDDSCFVGKEGEDPIKITRSAPQDAMNAVQVQWNNRSNQYSPEITQESDQAAINKWGERREDPQNWDFIHTLTSATFAANMRVKHNVYIRNTYEFTLPFTYSYLEPMDIVTISTTSIWAAGLNNANLGLVNQPVRITKIVDDPVSGLAITCEDYPWGAHLPTLYNKAISAANVVSNAYANPGNAEVVMFEASSRLTGYLGNEIWIGSCGTSSNWGSTNVWVSRDNTNFEQVGTIQSPARLGVLDSTFASGSDPDTVNSLVIDLAENCGALTAGSNADADNNVTLCFVDGEFIAYSACALSGQQQYTMNGYIRRGLMGSTISSHAAGSLFMRLDQSIFKYTYDPTWAGQTLYFKFQPVNAFGNSAVPLANLTATSFVVPGKNPGTIDASSGLVIANPANGAGSLGWTPIATTTDAGVNYGITVAGSAALPAGVNTSNVYGRWTGYLIPSVTGTYTVGVNSDDGVNLFIGTTPMVSNLTVAQAANGTLAYTQSSKIMLTAGVYYPILLEWQQGGGNYEIQLAWTPPNGSIQIIPGANLSTSKTSITGNLTGTWWNGTPGLYYPTGDSFVDPSGSGMLSKGSTPISNNAIALNGMTWSTTSTSATLSWTQTSIFRADGTISGFIAGGSQAVTSLVASQSYTAYPFWDENSGAMKWVGSELVFPTMTSVGFNGSTQFVTTSTAVTTIGQPFTLEAWIKTTSATTQTIMSLEAPQTGTGAVTNQDMELIVTSTGEIKFQYVVVGTVTTVTTSGAGVLDGAWHHIVVSFASGGTITIYVDTVSKGSASALGGPRSVGINLWFHIGYTGGNASWATTSNSFFNGSIAHVAYYVGTGKNLTATQVSNHFVTGINVGFTGANSYPSTVIADGATYYWKLNEASGTSAADSAGSNTGTYVASPTLNQQAPVVVPTGSPAYFWPYKNFLCTQAQTLQNRIPLSVGSLSISTPASGGGSGGGGGYGGGGSGGCWSGNTLIKTQDVPVRLKEWIDGTSALTAAGTWKPAKLLRHEVKRWKMIDPMHNGELVTIQHPLLDSGWKRAHVLYPDKEVVVYEDHVYDLMIMNVWETETQALSATTEHSYTLESGIVAHNAIMISK